MGALEDTYALEAIARAIRVKSGARDGGGRKGHVSTGGVGHDLAKVGGHATNRRVCDKSALVAECWIKDVGTASHVRVVRVASNAHVGVALLDGVQGNVVGENA